MKKGFHFHHRLPVAALFIFQALNILTASSTPTGNSNLFREYIGAEFKNVEFSDIPVNSGVEFHYILSFAIDYTTSSSSPSPTNGRFNIFWDTDNLNPDRVAAIKNKHSNVRVALSLGGDTVGDGDEPANFDPSSPGTWISNAVSSLTKIIRRYHLDGIDIDYEHFKTDPNTFAHCIGQLVSTLKKNGVVSFASIAPYPEIQSHYVALWKSYGHLIDYVNFQFYAYDEGTTVAQFLRHFEEQSSVYGGGKVLPSFTTDGRGGLAPDGGFFTACSRLKSEGKLYGIFVWCADDSKRLGFKYEKQSQSLVAISH